MSIAVGAINIYQKFVSPLFGANCRFYPTCSEYAKWVFDFENPLKATFLTTTRILRCNQLFEGGIDYPKVKVVIKNVVYGKKMPIDYFLVPYKGDFYYLIKKI
jgi:putative membrane protein insertion efficiency factor